MSHALQPARAAGISGGGVYVDAWRWRYNGTSMFHSCTPPPDIQGLTEYSISITTVPSVVDASGDRAFGIQAASNLAVTGLAFGLWLTVSGVPKWVWGMWRDSAVIFARYPTINPPQAGVRRNHVVTNTDNGANHTLRYYVDGTLVDSFTATNLSLASLFTATTPADKLYVGYERANGFNYYMRGDADNLVICSGVVDPSEFDSYAAAGGKAPSGISGMLHAWTLDKAGDTTTAIQDWGGAAVTLDGFNSPTLVAN